MRDCTLLGIEYFWNQKNQKFYFRIEYKEGVWHLCLTKDELAW